MSRTQVTPAPGQAVVERRGRRVSIIVVCADEYAAIELHDTIIADARDGWLALDIPLEVKGDHQR